MTHQLVPAESLYLALLDAPFSAGVASRKEELCHAFEPMIPGGFEGVIPVYRTLPDARVLAIGIARTTLDRMMPGTATASPAAWPSGLEPELSGIDPRSINLLVGAAEPAHVRAAHRRLASRAAGAIALVCTLGIVLLQQQAERSDERAVRARMQTSRVFASALGPDMSSIRQQPSSLLTSELRKLRATRGGTSFRAPVGPSADLIFADLLAAWPSDAQTQTESMSVTPQSAEIVTTVASLSNAERLLGTVGKAPGLSVAAASTRKVGDRVRIEARLTRGATP
ncbi:MAG: hypothetical protein AAGA55_02695 [Planctomycetota bacterium]